MNVTSFTCVVHIFSPKTGKGDMVLVYTWTLTCISLVIGTYCRGDVLDCTLPRLQGSSYVTHLSCIVAQLCNFVAAESDLALVIYSAKQH